jgi:CheY-like chemotaxis protein
VLLIEDDPAIAEMYRVQLEYDGYRITVATTGEVGYASMRSSGDDEQGIRAWGARVPGEIEGDSRLAVTVDPRLDRAGPPRALRTF